MKKLITIALLAAQTSLAVAESYSTTFSADEDPISESGSWVNGLADGTDWDDVRTTNGLAHGQMVSGSKTYADSYCILTANYLPDQEAGGTIMRGSITDTWWPEVEIRLRGTISDKWFIGYEIGYSMKAASAYIICVKFLGPYGGEEYSWQYLLSNTSMDPLVDGDTIKATIVGDTISIYTNDVLFTTVVDPFPVSEGSPGFGFYHVPGAGEPANVAFGLKDFWANDIGAAWSATTLNATTVTE